MDKTRYIAAKKSALEKYFAHLNDMQKKAVFKINGPVLVLAGAGSGKTSVLVNRIANMINFGEAYEIENCPAFISDEDIRFLENYNGEKDEYSIDRLKELISVNTVDSWRIMAITFTNKAAGELKERLEAMLGSCAEDITAATFHSVCVRILRREIDKVGFERSFTIYDSDDSQRLIKSCYSPLDISEREFPPKAVLAVISSAKDKLMTPEMLEDEAGGDYRTIKMAQLYKEYQRKLADANAVDFDDIICHTVRIFEQYPDVLDHYSNRYRYIMVDEYQDTNYAQLRLVTLLSQKYRNICVVGDDDQSIYRFRGATIENILNFTEQFDGAAAIRLEQNYRSTQNILSAANAVISNNTMRNEKNLWTDYGDGEKITLYKASDEAAESRFVASKIMEGIRNGGSYKDYAVLYRMNAQSNSIERAFTSNGIPYKVIGGQRFYDRKEIRDMVAYLSVINNNKDMLRFKRIINEPKRGIGDSTVALIERMSMDMGISPIEVMKSAKEYPILAKKAASLERTADMFIKLSEIAESEPLDELLDKILELSGYELHMITLGDEGRGRLENISELKSTMVEYMKSKEDGDYSLSEFLEEISLYTEIDKLDNDENSVVMMTVHSAKGLEFPTVFMVGMENGIFPSQRSTDTPEDVEEERRLAYVAITRAKEKLYLTHAHQRLIYGNTNRNFISRFVKEIPAEYIDKIDSTVRSVSEQEYNSVGYNNSYTLQSQIAARRAEQAKKSSSEHTEYSVGDRILHKKYGEGTIISVEKLGNDTLLEIAFEKDGTKKIFANFTKPIKI